MIKTIILTLAVTFSALGICDFLHTLRSTLLLPDVKTNKYSVLFLKHGHALSQLRFISFKLRWYGGEFADRVLAISDDLDPAEIALCEKYSYGSSIRICSLCDISSIINLYETGETDEREPSP
ncbi:MAG: hypothetical protein IKZ47_07595 [Clostridia bacterium]|nr:hypothetical protein [Clostridia bacterium]